MKSTISIYVYANPLVGSHHWRLINRFCSRAQGFLDIRMKKWLRNLMTRCIAIAPSLVVSIIGGSSGAGRLIIIASVG